MRKIGQSGLGLLEIVVASVLLGVLGIGAMRMIEGLTQSAKLNGAGAEIASIKMQIHTLLSSSQTCPVAFQDLSGVRAKFDPSIVLPENPTAAQIDAYLLANTLAQLKVGSLTLAKKGEKNGNFFVSSIQLTELDPSLRSNTLVNSIAARTIVASLDLSLVLGHSAEASGFTRQIRLPILITTNNTAGSEKNKILACSVNGDVPPPPTITTTTTPSVDEKAPLKCVSSQSNTISSCPAGQVMTSCIGTTGGVFFWSYIKYNPTTDIHSCSCASNLTTGATCTTKVITCCSRN